MNQPKEYQQERPWSIHFLLQVLYVAALKIINSSVGYKKGKEKILLS